MLACAFAWAANSCEGGKRRLSSKRASIAEVVIGWTDLPRPRSHACRMLTLPNVGRTHPRGADRNRVNGAGDDPLRRAAAELRNNLDAGDAVSLRPARPRR